MERIGIGGPPVEIGKGERKSACMLTRACTYFEDRAGPVAKQIGKRRDERGSVPEEDGRMKPPVPGVVGWPRPVARHMRAGGGRGHGRYFAGPIIMTI